MALLFWTSLCIHEPKKHIASTCRSYTVLFFNLQLATTEACYYQQPSLTSSSWKDCYIFQKIIQMSAEKMHL